MKVFKFDRKILILFLSLFIFLGMISCNSKKGSEDVAYYTCPMHPQIKMDQPGQCPICGMDLVPVRKEEVSGIPAEKHSGHDTQSPQGEMTIKIDPVRVQNIGVQTEEAQFRDLKKNLLVQGKVAHDPRLWLAQKEYLIALNLGDASLIRAAEEKLLFLGLSKEWIRFLKKSRKSNLGFFVPDPGKPTFFEAFLNQGDLNLVHAGQEVEINDMASRPLGKGVVRALGTVIDMESRTLRALIAANQSLDLKSNTLVQLKIEMSLGKHLSIPQQAILFNGDHNMVYVQTEPGKFIGKKIELGEAAGEFYEIKEGLQAGDKVVTNGHFLIDSETQMRIGGMSGHQH